MNEMDPATVLEEAADYLLIHGVRRGSMGYSFGAERCALGAIEIALGGRLPYEAIVGSSAAVALHDHLTAHQPWGDGCIPVWNDMSSDDFEIIDTLRHVAKNLRNEEVAS